MTLIKKNELKAMNSSQIEEKLLEVRKELLKLNSQRAVGTTMESPGRIKLIKRTIARLITIKAQKLNKEVPVVKKESKTQKPVKKATKKSEGGKKKK